MEETSWWKVMFSGLIESIGAVESVKMDGSGLRLRIETKISSELSLGDSIAVNGVCLTVARYDDEGFEVDVSPETIRVTSLNDGILRATVNLERPLQFDGRVGGHFVQGHVDAIGRVEEIRKQGEFWWLTISYPPLIRKWLIPKGAIAVDGISLTVATMDEDGFGVQIVPFTWANTRLHAIENGTFVNLECDMVGKYAVRALEIRCDSESVKDRKLGEKNGS